MAAASSDWKLPEDPPPDNTWVIVRNKDGHYCLGKYNRGRWNVAGKLGAISAKQISHWAEIYQPPKDNKKLEQAHRDKLIQHIKDNHADNQTE